MKIPSSTNAPVRSAEGNKFTDRKNVNAAENAPNETGAVEGISGGERDFASVLDEVARPGSRQEAQEESGVHRDAKLRDTVEHEGETHRREDRDESSSGSDAKGGGFDGRGGVREVVNTHDAAGARTILHIADLERIVSAVRTQALAGGRREVTLELRRSVLEGLRIKLSTDDRGRVTAEFVASSERMRAQLDTRANELAEVLRARGINLESLRTSVSADAADSRSAGEGERSFAPAEAGAASLPSSEIQSPDAEGVTGDANGDGATYRA